MSPRERKIEAALVDWFLRQGWEVDRDLVATQYLDDDEVELSITELARHVADELER